MKYLLILLVLVPNHLLGQTLTRGPYLQMASDTSMTIRWRTSTSVTGRVCFGTDFSNLNSQVNGETAGTEHEVKLTGLVPSTKYHYSVGVPDMALAGGDANHHFTTSPPQGASKSTRIWAIGDSGTGSPEQLTVRNAFDGFSANRRPDLMVTLGDNAYSFGTDADYQSFFFNVYPNILRNTPLWPALGNHDTANSTDPNGDYPYFQMFTLPTAGEAGGVASGKEHYYSFDFGDVHFICLDSMTSDRSATGPMATWLQSDLASSNKTWIIAYWHHPPYSKGSHNSDVELPSVEMRTNILPILEAGGVDLTLTGHSHAYERSFLIDGHYGVSSTLTPAMVKNPGNGREAGDGVYIKSHTANRGNLGAVHVVAGNAGSLAGGPLNHPVMSLSMNQLGSMAIDINGPRMDVSLIQPSGSPLGSSFMIADSFTIYKMATADTDGDRMPDEYEILHQLDPLDPADAHLDVDDDGISNLDEYLVDPNPANGVGNRVLTRLDPLTQRARLVFYGASGFKYRPVFSTDLGNWLPVGEWIVGNNSARAWMDDSEPPSSETGRFYRLEIAEDSP